MSKPEVPRFRFYTIWLTRVNGEHNHNASIGKPATRKVKEIKALVLEGSNFWLADGTFKLSPKNFYQIFTLHVYILSLYCSCLHVILPNKTDKTYCRLIDALETDCNAEKVLLDFELAPTNALEKHHPAA